MTAHVGWRLWMICMLTMILTVIVSVAASVRIARDNTAQQIRIAQEAGARGQKATCDLMRNILAAYEDAPPVNETGKAVQEAWLTEYRIFGCLPEK